MTVINTNVGALTARTYAVKATESTEQAMERLSSGLRINSAADDAAGLAVANKMESQLRGMNMAIRNSQDGISLVQTAESAMGEINNMAIRMRELAVQMNNGVYTDSDRTNAQLEVTALLAEIDKIANNAAFNEVKILDGTYSQDIRAGNTNPEIINVSIDRMNTDSLGGANLAGTNSIATGNDSTDVNAESRSSVDVTEAALVTVKQTQLGTEIQTFASTYATDGSYSLDATAVAAGWAIDSSGNITKSNVVYDTTNSSNNSVSLEVTYSGKASASGAVQTFKDNVSITIGANDASAVVKSATSTLTTQESANVSFRAVDSNNALVAEDGQLSLKMQEFVAADSYGGTWSISGTDADDVAISATGVVTASLNFENATDADTNNSYVFDVIYTSSTGDKFTESVTLNVTNGAEEIHTLTASPPTLNNHGKGTEYQVSVDGVTITAYKDTAIGTAATASSIAESLDAANQALSTKARGSFSAVGADIIFTFDDEVGNFDQAGMAANVLSDIQITRAAVVVADETGAATTTAAVDGVAQVDNVSGISGVLNSAANGDTFAITIGATTITTAALSGITATDNFSVADLASALNTANAALGVPAGVTFSDSGDSLVVTSNSTGAAGFTATNFQWTDTSAAATNTVGAITTATAGVTAVAEELTFTAATITAITDIEIGDKLSVTMNGVKYLGSALVSADVAGAIASLNGNADFAALYTASLDAISGTDLKIASDTAGLVGAFTLTDLSIQHSLAADIDHFAGGDGAAAGASAVTTEGSASNAYAGATHSASRVGTYTAATAALNGNFGTRSATEVSSAKNTITLEEAAIVKFGTDAMSSAMQNYMTTTGQTGGTFSLTGTDKTSFEINANTGLLKNKVNMDFETKTSYSFNVVYTDKNGDTFTDEVTLNLTNSTTDDVQHIADLDLTTQGGASSAISILDSAINQISASQAKLGAIQNRLEHNIDNLSMASMLTETSKGRIMDADFAQETSELSKQQILAQAATSMLAQANQSKQGVLALLQ